MVCFPLDNVEYDASALGAWSGTRTRGVYAADGHYAVTANGGMSVRVSPGLAWLQAGDFWGVNAYENAAQVLMLDTADGSLDRVDAVCVRLDKNLNKGELVVKSGAYTPQPPTIATPVRDANYDEIYVATVYVRAGATEILQSDITDQRLNEAYCGIMRDGVTGIPTEELQAQWSSWYAGYTAGAQQEFGAWFESMKGQLSEDAAGNLQNQINAHAHTGEDGTVKVDAGNISNLADYIVEQGVSGIWTYRKWASGIIECWGQTDIGAVGITNTTGNQYYSDTQYLDYPPLANQVDHVSLSAYSDITVYTLSEYWLANSKIAYRLMTGYQVTTPDVTRVSVYVMGRWQQNA